jgi:hypothetical protein
LRIKRFAFLCDMLDQCRTEDFWGERAGVASSRFRPSCTHPVAAWWRVGSVRGTAEALS